jgi:predicted amidohydrolase
MTESAILTAGLMQAELTWRDPDSSRRHLGALMDRQYAAADVVVMPETFTTGFLGDAGIVAEGMDGPTVRWMMELADRHSCVLTGSAVIGTRSGRMNRLLWVEPGGGVRHYDKKHLFSYAGEDRHYTAGTEKIIFTYRGWRICPQICYDIRFPVWCRNQEGYDLMLAVANWPAPRIDAWSALLKARAIENQAYVVAVNRVGLDGRGQQYPGQSVVHDPLGVTELLLGEEEAYAEVELSLEHVRSVRAELPFHRDADRFEMSE